MPRKRKSQSTIIWIAIVLVIAALLFFGASPYLKKAAISPTCEFTILSIDSVQTISNEPTLNNEAAYLLTVAADKGGECAKITITQSDLTRFGINANLYGDITLSAQVLEMSNDYRVYEDAVFYKVFESTASDDLSKPIPYAMTSLTTTQLSAIGKFSDPSGQAPSINHLGNFPSGGDPNLMKDIGEWAYIMPEASNIPFGADKNGNWWVTHMGGIPYYRGYLIDTMPYNKYKVQFILSREGETLASAVLDDQNRIASLGEIARIKAVGGLIQSVFPPQPGVDYSIVQGLDTTPEKDRWKYVSKYRYNNYKSTLDELVNFDNNYFVYSWSDMSGTLIIESMPTPVDVYIDNRYLGFTPLTIKDVPVGRCSLLTKKSGFFDAKQEINVVAGQTKISVTLAQISPPDVAIDLNPKTITKGQSATLTWSVKGVFDKVKLYDPTPSIVESTGSRTVFPTESITYVIEAIGAGGEKSAFARIGVVPPPPPEVTVSVSPQIITRGQSATLSWSVKGNVKTIELYDPQPSVVTAAESRAITPTDSKTYTIKANGDGGSSFGTARLQVNPPPPPPPPPPVNRDPGVGREAITDKENTLNNMLGLLSSENVAPRDCVFNQKSLTVICKPPYPVTYQVFQILLKASAVAMQISAGVPSIESIQIPETIYEGDQARITVAIKNVGQIQDAFDLSLQSEPSLAPGVQQFVLAPNTGTTATITFSGAVGTYKAKVVLQSRNNPFAKVSKDIDIKIIKKPLPEEIRALEKRTNILEDLIMKGYSQLLTLGIVALVMIIGVLIAVVILLRPKKWMVVRKKR